MESGIMADKNEDATGVSDEAQVPEVKDVTILFFPDGLRGQVLGDITARVKKARKDKTTDFIKATGLSGDNDIYLDVREIRMMEVTVATIRKQVGPAGKPEFRQPDFPSQ